MGTRQRGVRARGNSIQVDFHYQGKRCRETLPWMPTKANMTAAARMREAIRHEISIGQFDYAKHFPNSKTARIFGATPITVAAALDKWIESKFRECASSTYQDYRGIIDHHLKPAFGDRLVNDLTTIEIRAWVAGLTSSGKRINNILIPLRGIFDDLFADGLVERNPMSRIKNLPHRSRDADPFAVDEVARILAACEGQIKNLFQFAFWTGLRIGELLALEWGDIDWNNGLVRVRRSLVRGRTQQPKTAAGERDVKLLPAALEALQRQREHSALEGSQIFHNPVTGRSWESGPQVRNSAWKAALRRAGVRYRTLHMTRHTYASIALSRCESPAWVSQQMGHKDMGMIFKVYGRWIPDADPTAGSKMAVDSSQIGHRETASD